MVNCVVINMQQCINISMLAYNRISAAASDIKLRTCAPSEDSDKFAHSEYSLIAF